jgi:hypothetical protein
MFSLKPTNAVRASESKVSLKYWKIAPDARHFADATSPSLSSSRPPRSPANLTEMQLDEWRTTRPLSTTCTRRRRVSSGDLPPALSKLLKLNQKFERWSSQVKRRRPGVTLDRNQHNIDALIKINKHYTASKPISSGIPLLAAENKAHRLLNLNMDYKLREVSTRKVSTKLARSPFEELQRLNDAYVSTTQMTDSVPFMGRGTSVTGLIQLNSNYTQLSQEIANHTNNLCLGRSANVERLAQLGQAYNQLAARTTSSSVYLRSRNSVIDTLLKLNVAYLHQHQEQQPGVRLKN